MKSLITFFLISFCLTFTLSAYALSQIDVNTATQAQLEELPGVGPAIAKKIIESRPYKSLDDLKNVKGIGNKTEKFKDMIAFGETPETPAPADMTTAPVMKKYSSTATMAVGEKVSLNTASKDELMKLPYIGEKKAEMIIKARPFSTVEDIMKVKGIKGSVYAKIKDHLKL